MTMSNPSLDRFTDQPTVLLTTYRRDGTPVGTPVSIYVDGERAFIRTFDRAGKMKRIRRNPEVEIRPSTFRGRPTGPALRARARLLDGPESDRASRLLAKKHPVLHGILVPFAHRLRGDRTVHLELVPLDLGTRPSTRSRGVVRAGGRVAGRMPPPVSAPTMARIDRRYSSRSW